MTTAHGVEAQTTLDTNEPQDWGSIAVSFAGQMALPHFPRGDLAGLRRMDPDEPGTTAAYWRLMAQRNLLGSPAVERKWALILHGIALMTPRASEGGRKPHGARRLYAGWDGRCFWVETLAGASAGITANLAPTAF